MVMQRDVSPVLFTPCFRAREAWRKPAIAGSLSCSARAAIEDRSWNYDALTETIMNPAAMIPVDWYSEAEEIVR
jgi:hypothetical protein